MNAEAIVPATFSRRLGAMMYDSLLLFALWMIASVPVVMLAGGADSPFIRGAGYQLFLYLVSFVFLGWFWVHGGQTLGMRSWKLQVIRDDGHALGWDNALLRFLTATISLFLFFFGFLWILFNRENLAWHDIVSRTRVIHNPGLGKNPPKNSKVSAGND